MPADISAKLDMILRLLTSSDDMATNMLSPQSSHKMEMAGVGLQPRQTTHVASDFQQVGTQDAAAAINSTGPALDENDRDTSFPQSPSAVMASPRAEGLVRSSTLMPGQGATRILSVDERRLGTRQQAAVLKRSETVGGQNPLQQGANETNEDLDLQAQVAVSRNEASLKFCLLSSPASLFGTH